MPTFYLVFGGKLLKIVDHHLLLTLINSALLLAYAKTR